MSTPHSPLPWHIVDGDPQYIDDARDEAVADVYGKGNNEFIVLACNCHDELVKLVEAYTDIFPCNCGTKCDGTCDYSRAQAILAKAKGQP